MALARHELFTDLATHGAEILCDHGIDKDVAEQAATAIADRLAQHWGGSNITIPKDYHFALAARDLQIFDEFNGTNYRALARKYNMTERGMRKLIERVKKRETARNQGRLF
jgi:Mor family transcriptional regulator